MSEPSGGHYSDYYDYYYNKCKMLITLMVLASVFKLRKAYLNLLAQIFEYVRDEIELYKQKERQRSLSECEDIPQQQNTEEDIKKIDHFELAFESMTTAMKAISEDEVLPRFEEEKLEYWNLTSRNNPYGFINTKITFIWLTGWIIRHFILFPIRLGILIFGLTLLIVATSLVGYLKEGKIKRYINHYVSILCFTVLSHAISADITFHNPENRPKNGVCVANHTTPLDVLILMCDNCYSSIGQSQGGLLGVIQRALNRASPHIWFERSRASDRLEVTRRMQNHLSNKQNPPILIFPEGTCINNTAVMQFKKGSFELGSVIYPVSIKYEATFGNAFWNSSKYSYMQYLYCMMTSWAIVCKVWYLPPIYQEKNENSIDFAERAQKLIANQAKLADLTWDGQLKRSKPKKEMMFDTQKRYSKKLLI